MRGNSEVPIRFLKQLIGYCNREWRKGGLVTMIRDVIPMALWGHHVILTETSQGWSICILQLHSAFSSPKLTRIQHFNNRTNKFSPFFCHGTGIFMFTFTGKNPPNVSKLYHTRMGSGYINLGPVALRKLPCHLTGAQEAPEEVMKITPLGGWFGNAREIPYR